MAVCPPVRLEGTTYRMSPRMIKINGARAPSSSQRL